MKILIKISKSLHQLTNKKKQFLRLLGAEDMSTEGLLLSRVELWIQSVLNYQILNKTQTQVIKDLLSSIVAEAMSLKKVYAKHILTSLRKYQP